MDNNKATSKVWIVGLDGATFTLLKPLIAKGLLPNMARIIQEGVHGHLQSTVPPVTAPAWSSFMTGVNPGKHGVFDFTVRGTNGLTWANSRFVQSPTLWRILSHHDVRVGVINVPVTYPPEPVNGYLIPGFLTPKGARPFMYPPALQDELVRAVGNYIINVKIAGREKGDWAKIKALIEDMKRAALQREKAVHYFIDHHPTDFMMVVFMVMDKLQHVFWKYLDEKQPAYHTDMAKRCRALILPCYQQLDRAVGHLMEKADDQTTLLLMSDHGFGTLDKHVDINRWLADQGLLCLRKGKVLVRELRKRLGLKRKRLLNLHGGVAVDPTKHACIDWKRTMAFAGPLSGQGIFVNLKGREPQGTVEPGAEYEHVRDTIRSALVDLREPETNRPVVDAIYKREDLYVGPHVDKAPDLLVVMRDYSFLSIDSVRFTSQAYLRDARDPSGFHRRDGILMAWGDQITENREIENAEIIDIAPTVLHLMGFSVPRIMDGQVLKTLFKSGAKASRSVAYDETSLAQDDSFDVYSDEEADEVRQRLDDLGYL